jgi:hypothetical protein
VLVHHAKFVKATSGREHPQAATEYPPLCRGRGPNQERRHHVLHQWSSSRQHSSIWHQSLGPLVLCGTHPLQHASVIHIRPRSNGIIAELFESGTQVRN